MDAPFALAAIAPSGVPWRQELITRRRLWGIKRVSSAAAATAPVHVGSRCARVVCSERVADAGPGLFLPPSATAQPRHMLLLLLLLLRDARAPLRPKDSKDVCAERRQEGHELGDHKQRRHEHGKEPVADFLNGFDKPGRREYDAHACPQQATDCPSQQEPANAHPSRARLVGAVREASYTKHGGIGKARSSLCFHA